MGLYALWVSSVCHNKIPQPGCLEDSNLFVPILEAEKSKVQVLVHSVLGKCSLPGLQMATFLLCPYMEERKLVHALYVSFLWGHIPSWDLNIMISAKLITSQRLHFQIPWHWGLGVQHIHSGGTQVCTRIHFVFFMSTSLHMDMSGHYSPKMKIP